MIFDNQVVGNYFDNQVSIKLVAFICVIFIDAKQYFVDNL